MWSWGCAACVVFLAALIALAVPGWLHGFGRTTMPVAWGVEINPSLRRAAETLRRWRESGRLGAGERSFCMHPDAACYCAWFCPEEKSFLDPRFSLFAGAAGDYAAVCEGLDPSLALGRKGEEADWRNVLRGRGVAAVVLYDPDPKHVLPVLGRMYENPDEWTILSIDGEAAVVGWNPARADQFAGLRFDPARLVFEAAEDEAPAAPGRGPGRDPRPPDWTSRLGRQPIRSWESTASRVDLALFEDPNAPGRKAAEDRGYLTGGGGFSGLMGLPAADGTPGGPLGAWRRSSFGSRPCRRFCRSSVTGRPTWRCWRFAHRPAGRRRRPRRRPRLPRPRAGLPRVSQRDGGTLAHRRPDAARHAAARPDRHRPAQAHRPRPRHGGGSPTPGGSVPGNAGRSPISTSPSSTDAPRLSSPAGRAAGRTKPRTHSAAGSTDWRRR